MASTADLITGTRPKMAITKGLRQSIQSTESTFPANAQLIQAVVIVCFLILFFHEIFSQFQPTVHKTHEDHGMISTIGKVML